jgi:hypothetical protein
VQHLGAAVEIRGVMLGYQKLDVYQCAVRLLALCARLSADVPTFVVFASGGRGPFVVAWQHGHAPE